jgi:hypothetical protein
MDSRIPVSPDPKWRLVTRLLGMGHVGMCTDCAARQH